MCQKQNLKLDFEHVHFNLMWNTALPNENIRRGKRSDGSVMKYFGPNKNPYIV